MEYPILIRESLDNNTRNVEIQFSSSKNRETNEFLTGYPNDKESVPLYCHRLFNIIANSEQKALEKAQSIHLYIRKPYVRKDA